VKQTLFTYFLLCLCTTAFGQTGVLTGSVLDGESKTPLELATVSILRQDSSLLTYQLSDKNGKFLFDKLPLKNKLFVNITYTGYLGYSSSIVPLAGKADTLHVLLAFNNKDTNSVVVTTTIPIRMNGDTLEINPGAFKLKPDAVVEELLNQVSGITIWSDGTITVNGKKVQNLLVDGKPFLGSTDTRVATQNLPKSAIDKIQLYQEYDRSTINQQSQPQDSTLTMNIKLKESSKKGYFGKVGFGHGTVQRFESDLSFQVYNKRSSGGIGGGFNNINKNVGNLQEMFQNNTYRNYNPNLYNVGRFGTNGINKNHSFGGVLTHSFIETANSRQNNRIVVNYNKSGTDAYIADLSLQNRTVINNPQFIREEGVQNNVNDRHDLGVNYVKTNSYNDNLSVNGSVNRGSEKGNSSRFTEVRDSANLLQSTNRSTTLQQRQSDSESLNFNFAKADREDPLKSFTVQLDARRGNSVSERDVNSEFLSLIDKTKNTSYNRRYSTTDNSINIGGSLDYTGFKRLLLGRYNLFGINLSLTQRVNYMRLSDDNVVTDYDSTAKKYITNGSLTNQNKRELFEYTPVLALSKNIFKYTGVFYRSINMQVRLLDEIKTDKNFSSIKKRNLSRSFQFFRYDANVNYQYQKQRKYQYNTSASYTKNFEYPSIDQLYTVIDDINVYNTRIGNPFLRNKINHTINVNNNFNTQQPQAIYSVNGNIGGGYTRSLNPVVDSTINDPSGRRISYYVNADRSSNLNLNYNFNISRKLKKNSLQLMYDGRFGRGSVPNYVDRVYNISETGSLSNNFTLQYTFSSILVLNVGKSLQHYTSKQTAAGLRSFKNVNDNTRFGAVLNFPKNFTFSSTLDHINSSNLDEPIVLWNSFATYRFMKQQAELKLSAMDILKQYQNITNSVNSYGTTTRITNGLQQYFLLTFSYYPRKFGKTDVKRQTVRDFNN
jgi:hypothetical protein